MYKHPDEAGSIDHRVVTLLSKMISILACSQRRGWEFELFMQTSCSAGAVEGGAGVPHASLQALAFVDPHYDSLSASEFSQPSSAVREIKVP